jgi:hypothetical protein
VKFPLSSFLNTYLMEELMKRYHWVIVAIEGEQHNVLIGHHIFPKPISRAVAEAQLALKPNERLVPGGIV